MNLNSDIAPNKSVENARLRPRNKYKPDLYTPKYAYYIWQNHAANVIKYVETLQDCGLNSLSISRKLYN